jgi:aspartate racemase
MDRSDTSGGDLNGMDGGIGVVGGMGPAATASFFDRIIANSASEIDQGYPRVVIDNNTNIPDRTTYIVDDGLDPEPLLRATAVEVAATGVDVLTMPCNTAHYFIDALRDEVDVPFLDMLDIATSRADRVTVSNRIGLLATTGTIQSGLYQDRSRDGRSELLVPTDEVQKELVMGAIYGDDGIKAGATERPRERLLAAIDAFDDVDTIIAGCTEIELVLSETDDDVRVLKPMDLLATAAISHIETVNEPVSGETDS